MKTHVHVEIENHCVDAASEIRYRDVVIGFDVTVQMNGAVMNDHNVSQTNDPS